MPELTEANLACYTIKYVIADFLPEKILAAYVTTEEKTPGFVLLKDHEHKTVMMINEQAIVSIRRAGSEIPARQESPPKGA